MLYSHTKEATIMVRNADKKILCLSNCILALSLGALIILSCIDVVPSKQASLTVLAYSCMVAVVGLQVVSMSIVWKRRHRE